MYAPSGTPRDPTSPPSNNRQPYKSARTAIVWRHHQKISSFLRELRVLTLHQSILHERFRLVGRLLTFIRMSHDSSRSWGGHSMRQKIMMKRFAFIEWGPIVGTAPPPII